MKNLLFLFIGISVLLTSCSTDEAEAVADEFHAKLNEGEIDYIMDNLVQFGGSTQETKDNFRGALEYVHQMGQHEKREKSTGFDNKINNGVKTVKLSYTFYIGDELIHERVVLEDSDGTFKVLAFSMNPDEALAEAYVAEY
jgi:hypothetical protein